MGSEQHIIHLEQGTVLWQWLLLIHIQGSTSQPPPAGRQRSVPKVPLGRVLSMRKETGALAPTTALAASASSRRTVYFPFE